MTNTEMVKKYIEDFGSITPAEAFIDLGVYRLSACIYTLRKRGFAISTKIEKGVNRYGKKIHYGRYRFSEKPNASE